MGKGKGKKAVEGQLMDGTVPKNDRPDSVKVARQLDELCCAIVTSVFHAYHRKSCSGRAAALGASFWLVTGTSALQPRTLLMTIESRPCLGRWKGGRALCSMSLNFVADDSFLARY